MGHVVPGVVFRVDEQGWAALDRKEGAPGAYRKVTKHCLTDDGRELEVSTYEVSPEGRESFVRPSPNYVRIVREGLEEFGLGCTHLNAAAENRSESAYDAVFVYGTLMRGEVRHAFVRDPKCSLLAETYGLLYDCGEYPALRMVETGEQSVLVQGEFIRLRTIEKDLPALDQVEGFRGYGRGDSLFRRAFINVGMCDGRVRRAWTYLAARAVDNAATLIPSGDWRLHRGKKHLFLEALAAGHCAAGETAVLRRLVNRGPFPPEDEIAAVTALTPLASALERGLISERQLAQASGRWSVTPQLPRAC